MASRKPARVLARGLPQAALRDALGPLCGLRALTPTTTLRGRRRLLRVLDGQRKTVVRLVAEMPRRCALACTWCPCAAMTGRRAVRGTLEGDLGLSPAPEPQDEVALRNGGTRGVSTKVAVAFAPELQADRAADALALRLVDVIGANLPGTLREVAPESCTTCGSRCAPPLAATRSAPVCYRPSRSPTPARVPRRSESPRGRQPALDGGGSTSRGRRTTRNRLNRELRSYSAPSAAKQVSPALGRRLRFAKSTAADAR